MTRQAPCFGRHPVALVDRGRVGHGLASAEAQALADLLPLLACGEEAAAIAFVRLAQRQEGTLAATLAAIGVEEDVHQALLAALGEMLPEPDRGGEQRRVARRFHQSLAADGPLVHLARIAAVDAATCTILSRMLARGRPLARDPRTFALFSQIRADEARHVASARAAVAGQGDFRSAAAEARAGLARLIASGGEAFERLGVDPDRLVRDVGVLPQGLV
ncbi:3-oxoacyl-ACP synthase [Novosphingobium nitrogenifigens]|uniref:3-oxoacyl-ACP synthase n=1 Tax=Novosphingobium nitrogenifigens TaxID=378548 RepID=UPI000B174F3F|nr:3-oxoacyl-ACP synthase [Novosphingobium nitrogenifigens]